MVTPADLMSPKCGECGMTATEHQMFGSVRLLCSQTPSVIRRSHWERVVRREMAKELDRLGDNLPRLYRHRLQARAEEIRNG